WAWIAEGQHHGRGFVTQREIKQRGLLREAPGDEADADALAFGALEFAPHPLGVAITAADEAEAARARNRRSERAAGDETHGREHHRFLDAQHAGDHARIYTDLPARSFSFCALIMARMRSQSASESRSSSVK